MLDSNLEELEKISKGDDLVEEFKKEIKELNENETYTSWLTPEEDEKFILNTEKSISYDEGLSQGLAQGLVQGEKNKQIEIAKALIIKNNMTLEEISEITGLATEEIENIKKDIDK